MVSELERGDELIFVESTLCHSHVFGLEDDVPTLRRGDNIHHDGCKLLRALKLLILFRLIFVLERLQNLLLEDLLLQLA